MSDLSNIQPKNREFEVVNPATDEPTGLVFTLRPDSDEAVKKFERNWTNQQLRKRGSQKLTAEGIEYRNKGRIVAAVAGWRWDRDANWHGDKPEFSEEKLREVLKVAWIYKQLDEELANDAAFFQS